jgi:hypothetical protein
MHCPKNLIPYKLSFMSNHLKKIFLTYSFIYSTIFFAQAQDYQISLITCGPGDELYSAFGHNAIRVWDRESNQDVVYNYGTFDFNTPYFYVKFTQRTLDYMLSVSTYERFLLEYNYFQRSVREQVLDLNAAQKEQLIRFLQVNYLPENRFYRYDFFYDNCATKVRDVLEQVLGTQLQWNDKIEEPKTFRTLIDEYVYRLPWADFGIDLALGAVIDQDANYRERMFLPDYLEAAVAQATIEGDGPTRPLVLNDHLVLDFPPREAAFEPTGPLVVLWLFAILMAALTFYSFRKKKNYRWVDISFFAVLGLLGVLIFVLWFFTFHSQTKYNWNILWAFPLHLGLAYGLWKNPTAAWVRKYLLFALIMTNLALIFWIFGAQAFHYSLVPVLLVIILRANYLYYQFPFKRTD